MGKKLFEKNNRIQNKKGDVVIKASGITKHYGHLEALRGVDIELRAGEIVALLGDNGAGKSTLANIICGAIPRSSGYLTINGKEIIEQSIANAYRNGIQVVFQDLALGPDLTVAENIFLGHEILKPGILGSVFGILDRKKMKNESTDYLAKLGIGLKNMNIAINSLSGGERQALAVARAVTWSWTALLLDEPTAALGARQSALVYNTMHMAADQGLAVMVISHDIPKMLKEADRLCIMRHGEIIADVSAKDIDLQTVLSLMLTGQRLT